MNEVVLNDSIIQTADLYKHTYTSHDLDGNTNDLVIFSAFDPQQYSNVMNDYYYSGRSKIIELGLITSTMGYLLFDNNGDYISV